MERIGRLGCNGTVGDLNGGGRMGEDKMEVAKKLCMGNTAGKRRNKKGRTIGKMIMEVRKGVKIVKEEKEKVEGLLSRIVRLGRRNGEL